MERIMSNAEDRGQKPFREEIDEHTNESCCSQKAEEAGRMKGIAALQAMRHLVMIAVVLRNRMNTHMYTRTLILIRTPGVAAPVRVKLLFRM